MGQWAYRKHTGVHGIPWDFMDTCRQCWYSSTQALFNKGNCLLHIACACVMGLLKNLWQLGIISIYTAGEMALHTSHCQLLWIQLAQCQCNRCVSQTLSQGLGTRRCTKVACCVIARLILTPCYVTTSYLWFRILVSLRQNERLWWSSSTPSSSTVLRLSLSLCQ